MLDGVHYIVISDFADAAISGAIEIISGYLDQLPKKCALNHISKIEGRNLSHNSSEKASNDLSHGTKGTSNGETRDGSMKLELNGVQELAPDVSSETQSIGSEQATCASANNDLTGTKAYQGADVPGLYNLVMATTDYRGHRVVAQSVLPGILQGDKSDSSVWFG